jgi:hypothetical protein
VHIPPRGRLSRELKSTATKPATKGTTFFRARRELSTQGLNCWGRLSNSRSLIVTAPYIAVCPKTTSVRDSSREENLFVARAENVESGGAYRIVLEAEFAENAPETTRTSDLWFRRPTLYPTELRARALASRLYRTRNIAARPIVRVLKSSGSPDVILLKRQTRNNEECPEPIRRAIRLRYTLVSRTQKTSRARISWMSCRFAVWTTVGAGRRRHPQNVSCGSNLCRA